MRDIIRPRSARPAGVRRRIRRRYGLLAVIPVIAAYCGPNREAVKQTYGSDNVYVIACDHYERQTGKLTHVSKTRAGWAVCAFSGAYGTKPTVTQKQRCVQWFIDEVLLPDGGIATQACHVVGDGKEFPTTSGIGFQ
jgi:hypothetical protein